MILDKKRRIRSYSYLTTYRT